MSFAADLCQQLWPSKPRPQASGVPVPRAGNVQVPSARHHLALGLLNTALDAAGWTKHGSAVN